MSKSWSSQAIRLESDVCTDVHANAEGVVLGVLIGRIVLSIDLHAQPGKAGELGRALIEGEARCLAMRKG